MYRNYEIAGSAHATPDELNFAAAAADIEKGGRAVPPMACNEGPRSRFPNWPAFNAILRNLDTWVRTGTPAPHAEPILVVDGTPVLDRFGNVVGGIRSPFVEAPTSTWFGNSTGPSFCRIAGHEVPLTAGQLKVLYATPDDYVRAVTASASRLVVEGFLVKEDANDLIADANTAGTGTSQVAVPSPKSTSHTEEDVMTCLRCQRDVAPEASYCPACGAPQHGAQAPAWTQRRLVRIPAEEKIAGVCAGIADYLDVDVTLVRALWLALSIVPGAIVGGIVAYVLAWIVMPAGQATRSTVGRRLVAIGDRREDCRRVRRPGGLLRRRRDTDPGAVDRAVGAARRHHRRAAGLCCRVVDCAQGAGERVAASAPRRIAPPQFEHR